MTDWAKLKAQARPRQKTVRLCLRGDLLAELEADPKNEELQAQVEEATVGFTVRAMTRRSYRALEEAHPDKDGDSWDLETFPPALVAKCLVSPELEAGDDLTEILSPGQFDKLFGAAFETCTGTDDLPLRRRG